MNDNSAGVLRFKNANAKWWRKPLVALNGRTTTAELAILRNELRDGENGVWLNSRALKTGVNDLILNGGKRASQRIPLPPFVADELRRLLAAANLKKGIPDLVIWNDDTKRIRLVEVKCPHWDRPTIEQRRFFEIAKAAGVDTKVVEWQLA